MALPDDADADTNPEGITDRMDIVEWLYIHEHEYGFAHSLTSEPWHVQWICGDTVPAAVLAFERGDTQKPTPMPIPPKPLPNLEGEMKNGIIRVTDDGTTFVGILNDKGAALEVRWTGPGNTDVFRWLDAHRAAGAVDVEVSKAGLANCCLNGAVPPGWARSDFAPPSRG